MFNTLLETKMSFGKQMQRREFLRAGIFGSILAGLGAAKSLEATVKQEIKEIVKTATGYSPTERQGLQVAAYELSPDRESYLNLKENFGQKTILTKDDKGIVRLIIEYSDVNDKAEIAKKLEDMKVQTFATTFSQQNIVGESAVLPQAKKNYVQIGVFKEMNNVLRLKEKLMGLGYKNLIFDRIDVGGNEAYVVLIGPYDGEDESIKSTETLFSKEAQELGIKLDEIWTVNYEISHGHLEKNWLSLIKNEQNPILVKKPELEKVKVVVEKQAKPILEIIAEKSKKHGVDSDLISSIIQEESHFNPDKVAYRVKPKKVNGVTKFVYVKNKRGQRRETARGLMMISKALAHDKGIAYGSNLFEPEVNMEVGVEHLKELISLFQKETYHPIRVNEQGKSFVDEKGGDYKVSEKDLLLFVAAAYNHGKGAVIPKLNKRKEPTGFIDEVCGVREKIYAAIAELEQSGQSRDITYSDIEKKLPAETQRYVQRVKAQYYELKNNPSP